MANHAGAVLPARNRHRPGAPRVGIGPAYRVAHHNGQAGEVGCLRHHGFYCFVASRNKGRTQKQIFRCVPANGQFGGQQKRRPFGMRLFSRHNDF